MAVGVQAEGVQRHAPGTDAGVDVRKSEARSAALITSLKMLGKGLGVIKTLVIAAWFGASGALDAFWVSYTIPQLMPGLILGVVTTAFIPSFMRATRNGHAGVDWRGLNTLFTLVCAIVITIAVLVVLFRHAIVTMMAPGLSAEVHDLAAELTALMAVAVLFFGINSMLSAILQALRRFAVMSLESVVTNTVIIGGAILLSDTLGVRGLVYSVIAGFATHMLLLLWANRDTVRHNLRPAFDYSHQDFRAPARHMLPLLVGFFGSIGVTIVDRIFVSTLDAGAISILVYASTIAILPMEVFGHAVFTAFYPGLSRDYANGDIEAMRDAQVRGLRLLLFVLIPTTAALVLASGPVVSLLLERGEFSSEAAGLTAAALAALALSLPFRAINYFNFRVFHARKEPWTAVSIGLFGVSVNVLMDMLLIGPFGVVGIALATSIAMAACMVLSTFLVQRRQRASIVRPMFQPFVKLSLMTVAMIASVYALQGVLANALPALAGWRQAIAELAVFVPAALVFLAAGYLLRLTEVADLIQFTRRYLKRRGG